MELASTRARRGRFQAEASIPADQTRLTVAVRPDLADLALRPLPVACTLAVEQSADGGASWWLMGSCATADLRRLTTSERVTPGVMALTLTEQIYHQAVITRTGFPTRRAVLTDTAERYYQLPIAPLVRVSVDTDAIYAVDLVADDVLPAPLRGQHSAALIGHFTAASSGGPSTTATTSSRTTTAGSLITAFGSSYATGSDQTHTHSDNKSNTYGNQVSKRLTSNTNVLVSVDYNNAGTRGTTHTCTLTRTGSTDGCCVSASEFSGVAASPTVVSNTDSQVAGGTTAALSVTAAAASLFVGVLTLGGGVGATMTVDTGGGWAQLQEVDEGNSVQGHNDSYVTGVTGSQTASWTVTTGRNWGAVIMAFTEAGGASKAPAFTLLGVQ